MDDNDYECENRSRKRRLSNFNNFPSTSKESYPIKRPSINKRLQMFREVLTDNEETKNLRLHHVKSVESNTNPTSSYIKSIPSTSVSPKKPLIISRRNSNGLKNRLSAIKNDTRSPRNIKVTVPLVSNLPKDQLHYKQKCMEYIKSSGNNIYDTPIVASFSSESSISSSAIRKNSEDDFQTVFTSLNNNLNVPEQAANLQNNETSVMAESMDWDNFDEKIVLSNIKEIRSTMVTDMLPKSKFQELIQETFQQLPCNDSVLKNIYIVVDTNIFLSYLDIVKEVMEIKINDVKAPIIFIPWIVIQELDYMKDSRYHNEFLQKRAQLAIKFINDCLKVGNKLIQGQSMKDALKESRSDMNADDGILRCCLQIIHLRNSCILLSNDINLRNKSLLNNIPAYGHDEIIKILDPFNKDQQRLNQLMEIKIYFSNVLTLVLMEEMKTSFGTIWSKMCDPLPPWSLEDCLKKFIKHWPAIFGLVLPKEAKQCIEKFQSFLYKQNKKIRDVNTFLEYCMSLCAYLQNGYPSNDKIIEECITHLKTVG